MEVQYWVLSGLTGAFFVVIWWNARTWIVKIDKKFDELIKSVQSLGLKDAKQEQQISALQNHNSAQDVRLNDHAKRIRDLEIKK